MTGLHQIQDRGAQMGDERRPEALSLDLDRLFAAMRRQALVAGGSLLLAIFCGFAWILTSTPLYTAKAFILIDNKRIRAVENAYDLDTPSSDVAASVVDSQVEVIRSENVAEAVIKGLDLLSDPEMQALITPKKSLFTRIRDRLHLSTQFSASPTEPLRLAADVLRDGVDISRLPRTMVLQISYTSVDPEKAASIANAFAESYLADQLNAKYEATRRASDWLEQRMLELKQQTRLSDLAIQKYKADNGLITAGGKLVNEQQLNEINSQLTLARGETARAEAYYQRIQAIIDKHQTDAIVAEAIGNGIIAQLRSKYLDASKRESEISAKLGKEHFQAVSLRDEMREYEKLMFEELGRLAESYRSEVQIARSKEETLKANLEKSVGENAKENKVLVGLRELEREGEAYRTLYQSFFQRYQEALQQQSFPIIEARVITTAIAPSKPSHPRKAPILMLFALIGGLVGIVAGAWRESTERGFRGEEQVKRDLGLECLGIVPLLPQRSEIVNGKDAGARKSFPFGLMRTPNPAAPKTVLNPPVTPYPAITTHALDNPGSVFSETLLSVKLAADVKLAGQASKIIGVVSSLPGEGKSVIAKNLGSVLAKLSGSALLIDGDLRARALTRWTAPNARAGLMEAVINEQPIQELLLFEEGSGLSLLPTVSNVKPSHTSEFLASVAMKRLLEQVSSEYDYVVIDLPPLGPVVDARAIAPQIGAFVLVVEWRKTARTVVRNILANESLLYGKCLGVVLNKVNVSDLTLFESYGSKYYYYKQYEKTYYRDTREPALSAKTVKGEMPVTEDKLNPEDVST
jgi:succinoglycan biosynthesis transport protein ExoP